MGHLHNLISWAKAQGVVIKGIEPSKIPGRGTGILATRNIKAEEEILRVPLRVLRCLASVPARVREKLPTDATIQELLAADLALDKSPHSKPWKAVLPKMSDFDTGMPMLWPKELSELLPLESRDNLRKREKEFQSNWSSFKDAFPDVPYEEYTYAWLIVNTRSFYNETPETLKYLWEDRLALIPVADMFNHSDDGCRVYFSSDEYHIVADRSYKRGEELFISYSSHSNDYNLLEYGFIPEENPSDDAYIDDVVFPKLSKSHKEELERRDILGEYPLGSTSEEFRRTQGVLRLLSCTTEQFHGFLEGKEKGNTVQDRVDAYLAGLLDEFLSDVIPKRLQQIEELKVGRENQRALLAKRWLQIEGLIRRWIENYRNKTN
ncbi:hypothetical protein V8C35DRAFT_180029 [Trichoderma chlorosporum]